MKLPKLLLRGIVLFMFAGFFASPALAQIDDVSAILQSGVHDANILAREYIKPLGSGFGAGLNTGWTNTAGTHQKFGFDLTVTAGLSIVPDKDLSFDFNDLDLDELVYESGPMTSPTINGAEEPGTTLAFYTDELIDPDGPGPEPAAMQKLFEFSMPEGSGFEYVPAPMIKLGVGVVKNTDIMIRYMPEYDVKDFGSFKIFGLGVKHDIKQWLPGGNTIPVDITAMIGYTSLEVGADFELDPADVIDEPGRTENPYSASQWESQGIELKAKAWTFNALVGKTFPVLSIYAGLGFESSKLTIKTPGSYPTVTPNESFDIGQPQGPGNQPFIVNAVDDPLDIEIKGDNSFRALAGFRIRLSVIHISGSYTLSNYSSYNLGVGISIR